MKLSSVIGLRLQRQCLSKPAASKEEYDELFRLMQPAAPIYFSRPGDPPCFVHRAAFDDKVHNDMRRGHRHIVKGRFQGGTVGYVTAEDLELYIAAFKKPIDKLTFKQKYILDTITHIGPLDCKQLKEETGILNKEIMPVLHRLQEAFLVYEDQVDSDWERAWYSFEKEWYEVDINRYSRAEAIAEIMLRFLKVYIFAEFLNFKDWFRLPQKEIKEAVKYLEGEKLIVPVEVEGLQGWMRIEDYELLQLEEFFAPKTSFMLHKSDFLVRANESALKEKYKGLEVLQYLMIDGQFKGAVLGHWRIGPYDVEDIIVNLPEDEKAERKQEIVEAVAVFYKPPFSNILKYDGKVLGEEFYKCC